MNANAIRQQALALRVQVDALIAMAGECEHVRREDHSTFSRTSWRCLDCGYDTEQEDSNAAVSSITGL